MLIKRFNLITILAFLSLFIGISALAAPAIDTVENVSVTPVMDKIAPRTLPAGFYQFNNLEIFKGPIADDPPAIIEVIQKNEKSCILFEGAKQNQSISCVFDGNQNNFYIVQIEKVTVLFGVDQESALLSDFQAGDKINITGWLLPESKIIRAATIKNLGAKEFHQTFSGTVKKITSNGFVLTLSNGNEILIKTPIVEGVQVTVRGVFDKVTSVVSNILSIIVRPTIIEIQEQPVIEATSKKPSTLFKNFLRVFGL